MSLVVQRLSRDLQTDRTTHLSHKAIEPPGLAKVSDGTSWTRPGILLTDSPPLQADLDIFIDYARRMDFKDKDGKPLIPFHDSKTAFEHWRSTTKGRPCDYTGMSYDKLTGGSGIQWPCNAETSPGGTERLVSSLYLPCMPCLCSLPILHLLAS